jgi:hypothetical protein
MPIVAADFTRVSSNFDPLSEGQYRFKITKIVDQSQDEEWKAANAANPTASPATIVSSEVQEGDRIGAVTSDYLYFTTKEGKPSKMGLGKLKAYAEAILGQEAANDPKGIDTDALVGGEFLGFMKAESYMDKKVVPPVQKTTVKLAKILPAA